MCSYTCIQVRSLVALAHFGRAPAARLPVNPSSPVSALHATAKIIKRKKERKTGLSMPSFVVLELLELFPGSCTCLISCCKNRKKQFPQFWDRMEFPPQPPQKVLGVTIWEPNCESRSPLADDDMHFSFSVLYFFFVCLFASCSLARPSH